MSSPSSRAAPRRTSAAAVRLARADALGDVGDQRPERGREHRREAREPPLARLSRRPARGRDRIGRLGRRHRRARSGLCRAGSAPRRPVACGQGAAALNAAVAEAGGEILVLGRKLDLRADALRALVRPFADPSVGGVAGDQRYRSRDGADAIASGEQRYWDLDRLLKAAESRAGSTISATGAIYAVRRSLFRPVPPGVTDDFFTSTGAIAQGYRLVSPRTRSRTSRSRRRARSSGDARCG